MITIFCHDLEGKNTVALVSRNGLSFGLPILISCEGTWGLLVFFGFLLSAFSMQTVTSQAVCSKSTQIPVMLKVHSLFLWLLMGLTGCHGLWATPYQPEYFMLLYKSGLACQCWCVACGVPNLVTLFICHSLFYKVDGLRFLEEPGISVKHLYLGAHGLVGWY